MHYRSEQEAKEKWEARSQRLNFDNLFIIMTDKYRGKGVDYEHLQAFDNLPYPNKVVFTHKPYPEFKSAFYIKGFENENEVGDLFTFSVGMAKNITTNLITSAGSIKNKSLRCD